MGKKIRFINCQIDTSKRVLIPRAETEFWTGKALEKLQNIKKPLRVLDIFAGTGCIGIAILKALKNAKVDFVDIDKEAIKQIRINLKINSPRSELVPRPRRYKIYQSNLFEKLKNKKYDFIFANPPYVALNRINEVQRDVLDKEPRIALFAGKDGMFYIKKFLNQVKNYLNPDGEFFLEFDPLQKENLEKILKAKRFNFVFKKDQFRKYRWLKAF